MQFYKYQCWQYITDFLMVVKEEKKKENLMYSKVHSINKQH